MVRQCGRFFAASRLNWPSLKSQTQLAMSHDPATLSPGDELDVVDVDVVSKGEFARRRNVDPSRVSQWIANRQIDGDAIVGEGRFAQIRESVAVEQLRRRLDQSQMVGNGLTTRLAPAVELPLPAPPPPPPIAAPPGASAGSADAGAGDVPALSVEDRIKAQRLQQLERENRAALRAEAIEAGRLTDAADARQAAGRQVAQLVTIVEGALSDMATALAAEFKLPQRDVVHLLRKEFRKVRATIAADLRKRAAGMPELVELVERAVDADQDAA